jgi:hypothetical protein
MGPHEKSSDLYSVLIEDPFTFSIYERVKERELRFHGSTGGDIL